MCCNIVGTMVRDDLMNQCWCINTTYLIEQKWGHYEHSRTSFLKWPFSASFHLFLVFPTNDNIFFNKLMWKMTIQYLALGFKHTTFWLWVSSFNHRTRGQSTKDSFLRKIMLRWFGALGLVGNFWSANQKA